MPRVPPFNRPATYDDLEKVPDGFVAEIAGGELHASPRPAFPHAVAGSALGGLIVPPFSWGRGGPGGWWIVYEPELHLGPDVLVPDWAGWRRVRMPHRPDTPYCSVAPDWLCEIVSPSTAAFDRVNKLAIYAREAVPHAWLIDPIARTLEVLALKAGLWTVIATQAGDGFVRAEPFDAIELELARLWGEPAPRE
jgi:Putative restriction endonuclease